MKTYTKFLVKIENSKEIDINTLKRHLYINLSLFHMNEVDKYTLDITTKALELEVLIEYSDLKKCDLIIIQYNNLFDYMEKICISNGEVKDKEKIYIESINDFTEYDVFIKLKDFLD